MKKINEKDFNLMLDYLEYCTECAENPSYEEFINFIKNPKLFKDKNKCEPGDLFYSGE